MPFVTCNSQGRTGIVFARVKGKESKLLFIHKTK